MSRKWIIILVVTICVSAVLTEFINFIQPSKVNTTVLVETQSTSIEIPTATPTLTPTIDPTPTRTAPNVNVKTDIDSDILEYLIQRSNESGYPLALLQGMIQLEVEGTWDPNFVDNNDYGLMQINTCNHKHLKKAFKDKYPNFNILDYKTNIDCGIYILDMFKQELTNKLGRNPTETELLVSYNRGSYYVIKRTGTPDFNTSYYKAVIKYKKQYEEWNNYAMPNM